VRGKKRGDGPPGGTRGEGKNRDARISLEGKKKRGIPKERKGGFTKSGGVPLKTALLLSRQEEGL